MVICIHMGVIARIFPARKICCLTILLLGSISNLSAATDIPIHQIKHLFDIKGGASGSLLLPTDVAVHNDQIMIVDSGHHRIQVFNINGEHKFNVGSKGIKPGTLRAPVGIDVDSLGRFYVADTSNHRIQVFSNKGQYLTGFDVTNRNKLIRPVDVCISESEQLIYVSGNNNHRIMAFRIDGRQQREWGGDGVELGEFRYPATMALLSDKRIAVVDVLNSRIQLSSTKGESAIEVGAWGVLPGQVVRPKGVAVDKNDNIYISDSYMGVVQVFNDVGKFIGVLGRGSNTEKLVTPVGMAIDRKNRLYIAEMRANKISVWQIAPFTGATDQ